MKYLFLTFVMMAVLGCEKTIHTSNSGSINGEVISSDAQSPLPCHSTAFTTNYNVQPGKVPPFTFTKTLYPDTRVRTIRMMSRAIPNFNHTMYANGLIAYETIGTFTYSFNAAKFTGTTERWEYYTTSTGATGRRSLEKKNRVYNFSINPSGYCTLITEGTSPILKLEYANPGLPNTLSSVTQYYPEDERAEVYKFYIDSIGNPLKISSANIYNTSASFKYDYSRSGDRYSYIPTQYVVSQEYSLLEVMQWVPTSKNPRSYVAVHFLGVNSSGDLYHVTQSQNYKNHIYDEKKNLISYTYGDNVLQRTTWYCR